MLLFKLSGFYDFGTTFMDSTKCIIMDIPKVKDKTLQETLNNFKSCNVFKNLLLPPIDSTQFKVILIGYVEDDYRRSVFEDCICAKIEKAFENGNYDSMDETDVKTRLLVANIIPGSFTKHFGSVPAYAFYKDVVSYSYILPMTKSKKNYLV